MLPLMLNSGQPNRFGPPAIVAFPAITAGSIVNPPPSCVRKIGIGPQRSIPGPAPASYWSVAPLNVPWTKSTVPLMFPNGPTSTVACPWNES